jgi:hypothetical protein
MWFSYFRKLQIKMQNTTDNTAGTVSAPVANVDNSASAEEMKRADSQE